MGLRFVECPNDKAVKKGCREEFESLSETISQASEGKYMCSNSLKTLASVCISESDHFLYKRHTCLNIASVPKKAKEGLD